MNKTEIFIDKALKVHGQKYNYSYVKYIKSNLTIDILCKQHGIFKQTPNKHLTGHGCRKCAGNMVSNSKDFIEKACKIHGDKYDYTQVKYINTKTKLKIICKIHGDFEQLCDMHLGGFGCPKCNNKIMDTKNFIKKAIKIHGDKYNYINCQYINLKTKVKINCLKHGDFNQTPYLHLKGSGCISCAGLKKYNTDDFVNKAKKYIIINIFMIKQYILIIPQKL